MPTRVLAVLSCAVILVSCGAKPVEADLLDLPADVSAYAPLAGFGEMAIPADNPLTPEKAALGRQLYYDYRLSGDGSRSCYHCHVCEKGLTDGLPLTVAAYGKTLSRSAPTMWNIGFHSLWYWDGRADTLEGQVFAAWKGGNMGAGDDLPAKVDLINAMPEYKTQFQAAFGEGATKDNIPQAIASYVRTIVGGRTPYDAWQAGDEDAVSEAAKRGHGLFQDNGCAECHSGVLLTDMVFHNVGIGFDASTGEFADIGRFKKSGNLRDTAAFKTPTLRDITRSAPYFHDGSVGTLEEAVRLMLKGGIANPHQDEKLLPRNLSEAQVADLMAFLEALDEPCDFTAPALPPDPR